MDEQAIGRNIRALRERAGLTATSLAERAGLSKGSMSKIEQGQISPPISTLIRIADGLGCRIGEFFEESDAGPQMVLTRKGEGRTISHDGDRFGYSYEALALDYKDKPVEPFILTINPGDPVGRFRHGGQEFIHMLAGRLACTLGDETVVLRPGDSLYFDPRLEHRTQVLGKTPARFLTIFVQTGDRAPAVRKTRRA